VGFWAIGIARWTNQRETVRFVDAKKQGPSGTGSECRLGGGIRIPALPENHAIEQVSSLHDFLQTQPLRSRPCKHGKSSVTHVKTPQKHEINHCR